MISESGLVVLSSSHLFAFYSLMVDLKVHEGLYLVYMTPPHASMGLHVRKSVRRHDIFILNLNPTNLGF